MLGLRRELHKAHITNGRLRLRIYDLERAFRLAEEAGIELPDPSDYSQSGLEYSGGEDTDTGAVSGPAEDEEETRHDV